MSVLLDCEPETRIGASICITGRTDRRVLVQLCGQLDCAIADELHATLIAELDAGRHLLHVDLSEVEFMDCSVAGVLAAVDARCQRERAALVLSGVRPPVARLLTLCQLDRVLLGNRARPRPDGAAVGR